MGPEHVRDPAYLIMCRHARKQRQSQEQLRKHTSGAPHVDGAVVRGSDQHLRCSVEPGLHVLLRRPAFHARRA